MSGSTDSICPPSPEPWRQLNEHILRVHGDTILQEKEVAKIFEVGQRSLEGLFPEFTEDSSEQAPANEVLVTKEHMFRGTTAGLLLEQPSLARLSAPIELDTGAFLDALDDRGSTQSKVPTAQPSRTQQCQTSSRVAPLHRTIMTTPNPRLHDRTLRRRLKYTLHTKRGNR